jgi:type I restriction enzyme M protein
MNQNPNIPQLFRDIFNNAYLPYRDPETLKLFLKEINNFEYSHSEKLGDAFEYLLSFMGTQGDAGQFRTPRHIIDFIVEVVDPQKTETILDPGCGTAGFLISAYKHILKANDNGKKLTPTERKRLLTNLSGYDISPDMVRLSLVNLYLHGFQDPKIYEYDTLTSEERWDETVDVVLANPPFMTPTGGIRPHKRFSVQAKRSEVLFVDYIAGHLNPSGRAGVIVPEGIIFQSSKAYKALRKMMVEDYLWAVVSLPAGVFKPYSGVKTSILLMDKTKAKQNDSILFVKVENDGFDLGAQRRPIDKNDLPEALEILQSGDAEDTEIAHWVEKSKIEESGDWNLSGERYKDTDIQLLSDFDSQSVGEILEIQSGYAFKSKLFNEDKGFPIIRIRNIKTGFTNTLYNGDYNNDYVVNDGDLLIGMDGEFNTTIWSGRQALLNQRVCRLHSFNGCLKEYVYRMIQRKLKEIENNTYAVTVKHISAKQIREIQIPLPPLSVQEEIMAEIDGYQKIIDGARQVVENYKPTIKIDLDWEMVKLGEVELFKIESGGTPSSKNPDYWGGDINWATLVDLPQEDFITKLSETKRKITGEGLKKSSAKLLPVNSVLVSSRATIGRIAINKSETATNQGFKNIVIKDYAKADTNFVAFMVSTLVDEMDKMASGGTFKEISKTNFSNLQIPLPPLSIQQKIVALIEAEQGMVAGNKKLIEIFEQKVKDKIGEVWGE